MATEVAGTRIALTSRAPDQLGARAVVRLFPTLDALEEASAATGRGAAAPLVTARKAAPGWPGDPMVRPMRDRPGHFHVDYCVEWRPDAAPAPREREAVIRRALHGVGQTVVAEARRWGCRTVALPVGPAARDPEADRARLRTLCEALVRALKQPGPPLDQIWLVVAPADAPRKQRVGEELLAAMGRRPSRQSAPRTAAPTPPAPPAPAPEPVPASSSTSPTLEPLAPLPPPIALSSAGTFVDTRLDRFLPPAHDDAVTTRMPHPIAIAWHMVTRRVEPAARLQALLHAVEVTLRTLGAVLLADYLRGPNQPQANAAAAALTKPTLGHWSKAIDALGRAIVERREGPFAVELGDWLLADGATGGRGLTRVLVELRNEIQHGRRGVGQGAAAAAAEEAEALLRQLLDSLRWLEGYRIAVPNDMAWTPRQSFDGHLVVYRGRERFPRLRRAEWRGGLAHAGCYLIATDHRRALDLAPFVSVHPDAGTGDDTLLLLESLPRFTRARLRQPVGATVQELPLTTPGRHERDGGQGFWAGRHAHRLVGIELLGDTRL